MGETEIEEYEKSIGNSGKLDLNKKDTLSSGVIWFIFFFASIIVLSPLH